LCHVNIIPVLKQTITKLNAFLEHQLGISFVSFKLTKLTSDLLLFEAITTFYRVLTVAEKCKEETGQGLGPS